MIDEVTRYLSEKIGERRAGTPEDKIAADYIAEQYRQIGFHPEIKNFKFLGWEMIRRPKLTLLKPEHKELDAGITMFSGSTPAGGIQGRIEYVGTMYLIPKLFEWPKAGMH